MSKLRTSTDSFRQKKLYCQSLSKVVKGWPFDNCVDISCQRDVKASVKALPLTSQDVKKRTLSQYNNLVSHQTFIYEDD